MEKTVRSARRRGAGGAGGTVKARQRRGRAVSSTLRERVTDAFGYSDRL